MKNNDLNITLPEEHYKETRSLLKAIDKNKIATWLLEEGYFPEQNILPPSFKVGNFVLKNDPYIRNLKDPSRRNLGCVSYPKSFLTYRVFGIQHPHNYHDIVYWLIDDWDNIVDHIFVNDTLIYTYSIPIPVNASCKGELSPLRSGRLIYEWIEMAERDLVAEANKFKLLIRTDIDNFYNSVYTHSIAWALHGRDEAFSDKNFKLIGNKIDRLVQYANDGRTNGIPVGSAVSDLIAELLLAKIDQNVSLTLKEKNIKFLGTRFKDDYRILVNTDEDAQKILLVLSEELHKFNLFISEDKTKILCLPEGLFRHHNREYFPYSLRKEKRISFKSFEFTLLKVLDIHKAYPGTGLIEKFLSELFDKKYNLKLDFSSDSKVRKKQILKTFSLLFLLKRESEKILCYIMAIIEDIYFMNNKKYDLKNYLCKIIELEIKNASEEKSVFEIIWYIFFSRYLGLGLSFPSFKDDPVLKENLLLKSMLASRQKIFSDTDIILFKAPKYCHDKKLAKQLAVFNRSKE
jgi:hypothetical protein